VSAAPTTRHGVVLNELRKRIIDGTLRPGHQIFADNIADEFGVSRIPVREALRILEGEGQVSYEPHRGYFVAELRLADLLELYLMRQLLESEALRHSVPRLDAEDFDRMVAAQKELDVAHASGNIIEHVAANRRFHFAFLEPLEMPRLLRQIKVLYDQCDPYGSLYYNSKANRQRVKREHRELVKAARAHDVDRVVALMAEHRQHVVDALSKTLVDDDAEPVVRRTRGRRAPSPNGAPASRATAGGARGR
jgi:DNA-binding GntR family transcriptional regulator